MLIFLPKIFGWIRQLSLLKFSMFSDLELPGVSTGNQLLLLADDRTRFKHIKTAVWTKSIRGNNNPIFNLISLLSLLVKDCDDYGQLRTLNIQDTGKTLLCSKAFITFGWIMDILYKHFFFKFYVDSIVISSV